MNKKIDLSKLRSVNVTNDKKMDARTRRSLTDAKEDALLHCIVKLTKNFNELTEEEKNQLSQIKVLPIAGEIITARIPCKIMDDILKLDIIQRIEGSRNLYPE